MKQIYSILLITALTLVVSCGLVSQHIQTDDLLKWEPDIAVFDSLNSVEFSDDNTLLVTGSSSVRLWDSIHADMAPYQVLKRGYGGAKLTDFNYYAGRIIKPQPFKAILIFVANDISGGDHDRTPGEVYRLYKALVKQIRERNPGTPVGWIETTPTPSRWHAIEQIKSANKRIYDYTDRQPDLFFIETFDLFVNQSGLPDSIHFRKDMLHLNRSGYILWNERIKFTLENEGILP